MALSDLVSAELRLQTTLVVPPARTMERNDAMLARIAAMEESPTVEKEIEDVESHCIS